MRNKDDIPEHIQERFGGSRQFKAIKRRQCRATLKALDQLRFGCAFIPDGATLVTAAREALTRLQNGMKVSNWGR